MTDACARLHEVARSAPRHDHTFSTGELPENGLYLVFEEGERAHGSDRIVRVGSHTGQGTLCSRLAEHFVKENKDRSIFRKNIGRALLSRSRDPYLEVWEKDLTSRAARENPPPGYEPRYQEEMEQAVTRHLRGFSFVLLPVPSLAERREVEKKIASLLCACAACRPSDAWLGLHSPKELIRESGLWQVNGLHDVPLTLGEVEGLRG